MAGFGGRSPVKRRFFSAAIATLLLCGCQTAFVPTNQPLPQNAQGMPEYRPGYALLPMLQHPQGEIVFIMAFSGGGKRSAAFAHGVLRGLRLVSDPRGDLQNRDEAYLLRNFLTARLGRENWQCQDLPLANGETPVDGVFVKQDCRKEIDQKTTATLATRYLRKAGQSRFDPHSGQETSGQFDSTVRFELVQTP